MVQIARSHCVSSALTMGKLPPIASDNYENALKIGHLPSWTTPGIKGVT